MTPIFATSYLPSVYYIGCVSKFECIAIERKETFPKQTLRNRCTIATGNGLQTLTVPIIKVKGNHTLTEEIEISYQEPWNIRHWRSIVSAYSAAPYFLYYRDGIEEILSKRWGKLIDLNFALLQEIIGITKIDCKISATDYYYRPSIIEHEAYSGNQKKVTWDFREDICSKHFKTPTPLLPYCQVFDSRIGFQQNLSILDLIFNLGPESKEYLNNIPTLTTSTNS